jgi:hypothetical protein
MSRIRSAAGTQRSIADLTERAARTLVAVREPTP